MILKIQIASLCYSFLYGIFFSFLADLNYILLYNDKKHIKVLSTMFFIINNVLLYFIMLQKINNGIVHIYLIISFLLGVIIHAGINKIIAKYKKRCYNFNIGDIYENKKNKQSI